MGFEPVNLWYRCNALILVGCCHTITACWKTGKLYHSLHTSHSMLSLLWRSIPLGIFVRTVANLQQVVIRWAGTWPIHKDEVALPDASYYGQLLKLDLDVVTKEMTSFSYHPIWAPHCGQTASRHAYPGNQECSSNACKLRLEGNC